MQIGGQHAADTSPANCEGPATLGDSMIFHYSVTLVMRPLITLAFDWPAVEFVKALILIDTRVSVTKVGGLLYEKIQEVKPIRLQTKDISRFVGVGANPVPILSSAEVGIEIGMGTRPPSWLVHVQIGPILSLGSTYCPNMTDFSLRRKLFLIRDEKVDCIPKKLELVVPS